MRAMASVECVTRLSTYPPRTAANTARVLATPYTMPITSGTARICAAVIPIMRSVRAARAGSPRVSMSTPETSAHTPSALQLAAFGIAGGVVERRLLGLPRPDARDGLRHRPISANALATSGWPRRAMAVAASGTAIGA